MSRLFHKSIEPCCGYCKRGEKLTPQQIVCKRYGVVAAHSSCHSFKYDPLKRVPPPQVRLMKGYSEEDLKVD